MTRVRSLLLAVAVGVLAGCGSGGGPAGPGGAASAPQFVVEVKPTQLAAGQKQDVDVTLTYVHAGTPAAATTIAYTAQVAVPEGWAVAPDRWEYSQQMQPNALAFRERRTFSVTAPAGAVGEQVLKLTVTPTSGPPQTLELKFQVAAPDG